jgi:acetylornithine/succinyldiaminopimelate/putrescine aminotransferase
VQPKEINEKYRTYLYGLGTYYKEPLPFVRGEGKWLFGADGKQYLDFFGGILTVSLGHCDPRVVGAIEKQARTLQHVSTLFPTIPIIELAEAARAAAERFKKVTWEGLVAETVAFGSPDTVARHIQAMRDMGIGHVLCWMNFGGLPQDKIRRSMELFAREVMPHFRDA